MRFVAVRNHHYHLSSISSLRVSIRIPVKRMPSCQPKVAHQHWLTWGAKMTPNVSVNSLPLLAFLILLMDGLRMLCGLGASHVRPHTWQQLYSNLDELGHRYHWSNSQPTPCCLLQMSPLGWLMSISPAHSAACDFSWLCLSSLLNQGTSFSLSDPHLIPNSPSHPTDLSL